MNRDSVVDWKELSALYERADELDPAGLTALLGELRLDRHRLLPQLERMLTARIRVAADAFLEALPALPAPPQPVSAWVDGARIGPYRLIRHLGSGGMAEVWLAERVDGAFERRVAIKLLFDHPARDQRERYAERFRRERDILASLDHPHIAALHDAGVTAEGQPWLALEHVEGEPITAWCEARALEIPARVELFRQVLAAVEHAHTKLVIHRDLKPGNILVTAAGTVKLLDFGIAKLLEGDAPGETELTRAGGRPLTLSYASPEQVEGKGLTTACDVYSAGVVLCELVAGQRPFAAAGSAMQLAAAIVATEPPPPSRLAAAGTAPVGARWRRLGRARSADLDAVVSKSLAKEPTRRYGSAAAMGVDLGRWSERRPVEAQGPSLAYRARRFALRHRLGLALASSAVIALLAVSTLAVVFGLRAREEALRMTAARDFMQEQLRIADPDQSHGGDVGARAMLARGRLNAEQMFAAQPALLAQVLASIGDMQVTVGAHAEADATLRRVVALLEPLDEPDRLARAQAELAVNAQFLGDVALAERAVGEAVRLARGHREDHALQGRILFVRGLLAKASGRPQDARDLLLRSIGQSDRDGRSPEVGVESLQVLVDLDLALGDREAASRRLAQARERVAADARIGPRVRTRIELMTVRILFEDAGFDRVRALLAETIPECDKRLGPRTEECLIMRRRQVVALQRTGRIEEAMAGAAVLLDAADAGGSPRRWAETLFVAASALAAAGAEDARPDVARALEEVVRSEDQSPEYRAIAHLSLAELALARGDDAQAASQAQAVLRVGVPNDVPASRRTKARLLLALSLQHQGRFRESMALFEESIADYAKQLGAGNALTLMFQLNAVATWRAMGRDDRVQQACADATRVLDSALGSGSPAMQRIARHCAAASARSTSPSLAVERFL